MIFFAFGNQIYFIFRMYRMPLSTNKTKNYYKPNKFNKKLWECGKATEDALKPEIDKFFGCDFYRKADIFDILDFHDDNKKVIVEVKGRTCSSTRWKETILTCGKITEGLMEVEKGYDVYIFFVFTDKTMFIKLDPDDCDWDIRRTGTRYIPHYCIPINRLTEFTRDSSSDEDTDPEPEPVPETEDY